MYLNQNNKLNVNMNRPPLAKVVGVRYGILSSDDVKRNSVGEINNNFVNRYGMSAVGGVKDPKLGSNYNDRLCLTCYENISKCPSHEGHTNLVCPIFNIEYIDYCKKVLNAVCVTCSRLRIPESHPKFKIINSIESPIKRFKYITKINVTKCGDGKSDVYAGSCHEFKTSHRCNNPNQPKYVVDNNMIRTIGLNMSTFDIYNVLKFIPERDRTILGFTEFALPESMMWYCFPIPGMGIRPSRSKSNNLKIKNEDDLTVLARDIIKENNIAKKSVFKNEVSMDVELDPILLNLQIAVSSFQKKPTKQEKKSYGRAKNAIHCRLTTENSKELRIRGTIFGKRNDFTFRTPIYCDSYIAGDEAGIPIKFLKTLIIEENVFSLNIKRLTGLVRRGPDRFPGANYVEDLEDNMISLSTVDSSKFQLKIGMKVYRHPSKGDMVVINRQPSLTKNSYMTSRIVPVPYLAVGLNPCQTKSYNGDFDGDEVTGHVPITLEAQAEAQEILYSARNLIMDGKLIICPIQNHVLAAWLFTDENERFDGKSSSRLLMASFGDVPNFDRFRDWSGRDLLALCLPNKFNMTFKKVCIKNNKWISGRLSKDAFYNLIFIIRKDYGAKKTMDFITNIQRLLDQYLDIKGISVRASDADVQVDDDTKTKIDQLLAFARSAPKDSNPEIEASVSRILDHVRDVYGDNVIANIEKSKNRRNFLSEMISSGAKGNKANLVQSAAMLGQQRDHIGNRMSETTSHSKSDILINRGLILSSFYEGMNPIEHFRHAQTSRDGLKQSCIDVAGSGWNNRRVGKCTEDIVVRFDGTVRNSRNRIVLFKSAGDGTDVDVLEKNTIRFLTLSDDDIRSNYGADSNDIINLKLSLLSSQIGMKHIETQCNSSVNFERLWMKVGCGESPTDETIKSIRENTWKKLTKQIPASDTLKMKCLIWDWLSIRQVRKHKTSTNGFQSLANSVIDILYAYQVTPNEAVGSKANHSTNSRSTQGTLNRFHFSGQKSSVITGLAAMTNLLNIVNNETGSMMRLVLKSKYSEEAQVIEIGKKLVYFDLKSIVKSVEFDSKSIIISVNVAKMSTIGIGIHHVAKQIIESGNENQLISKIKPQTIYDVLDFDANHIYFEPPETDKLQMIYFYKKFLEPLRVSGIKNITDFSSEKSQFIVNNSGHTEERWVIITQGSNFSKAVDNQCVDQIFSTTENIPEMLQVLGVHATRKAIEDRMCEIMQDQPCSKTLGHIKLIASTMSFKGTVKPMTFSGICDDKTPVIKMAAFEKAFSSLILGAVGSKQDNMKTVSESIAWNSPINNGTGTVKLLPSKKQEQPPNQKKIKQNVEYHPIDVKEFLRIGLPTKKKQTTKSRKKRIIQHKFLPHRKKRKMKQVKKNRNSGLFFCKAKFVPDSIDYNIDFCVGKSFVPDSNIK